VTRSINEFVNCPLLKRSNVLGLAIGLSTATLIGLSYWVACVLTHPDEPVSIRIMYRYDDNDYLPFIYALARLKVHEFVTLDVSKVLSFPLLFDIPHSAMIATFGDWGFAVGDALVTSIWFILFLFFAKVLSKDPRVVPFIALAMLVAAGPRNWAPLLPAVWRFGFDFQVWGFRYTRPFVAGLFMLALVLTTRLVMKSLIEGNSTPRIYATQGLLLGGTAQGDVHLAIIGCFVTASLYIYSLVRGQFNRILLKPPIVTALGFALGVFPMTIQQVMGGSAEYTARLGMFPVNRSSPPIYFDSHDAIEVISILILWGAIWLLARRYFVDRSREINLLLGVIFLYIVFSILAMPLSAALTGHAFLLYEFHDRRARFSALGYIVVFGVLLALGHQTWKRARLDSKLRLPIGGELVLAVLLVAVGMIGISSSAFMAVNRAGTTVQPRVWDSKSGWPALANYRSNFAKLSAELNHHEYDNARVLATFDQQLAIWWLAFRKGYLFIRDPLLSSISDTLIENRTLQLLKLVGASSEFLERKLDEDYFVKRFFGHDKWQASKAYSFSELTDYSPEQIEEIGRTSVLDSWFVFVPRSERERLVAAFMRITEPGRLPDLIILPNGADYDKLSGPGVPYHLAYENATFRVWLLMSRQTSGPTPTLDTHD
jgi:hypothetical protein